MSLRSQNTVSSPSPTTTLSPSPYHWALPPEVEVEADPLQVRLDFHMESVVLHDYADSSVRVRLVSALDIAHTLAQGLDLTTGLLPLDTLWWARTSSGIRLALWREAQMWTVRLREQYGAKPRRFRLPLPGLVFVCASRQPPYVFAARKRPSSATDQLYYCPTYNVFPSGQVCAGSEMFPVDPAGVPDTFFRSYFSPHTGQGKSVRYPDDIGRLWTELHRQDTFPLDDLVPQLRVTEALRIGG